MSTFLAHDLLWGMTPQALPADAPAWVIESLSLEQPVVVRRAITAPGHIAVGVRGVSREQRYATSMPVAAIQRRVRPEDLCHVRLPPDLRALQARPQVRPVLGGSRRTRLPIPGIPDAPRQRVVVRPEGPELGEGLEEVF